MKKGSLLVAPLLAILLMVPLITALCGDDEHQRRRLQHQHASRLHAGRNHHVR